MENRDVGYLAALKKHEGPKGVMPLTSLGKFAQKRKQVRMRMRYKCAKGRCDEQLNSAHQPTHVKEPLTVSKRT